MTQAKPLVPLSLQPGFHAATFSPLFAKENIAYAWWVSTCRTVSDNLLVGLAGTQIHHIALRFVARLTTPPAHFMFIKKHSVIEIPAFSVLPVLQDFSCKCCTSVKRNSRCTPHFRPHPAENHCYYISKDLRPLWHCFIMVRKRDSKELFSVTSYHKY